MVGRWVTGTIGTRKLVNAYAKMIFGYLHLTRAPNGETAFPFPPQASTLSDRDGFRATGGALPCQTCLGQRLMAFHFSLDAQAPKPYHGDLLLHSGRYFVVKFLETDHVLKLAHKVN